MAHRAPNNLEEPTGHADHFLSRLDRLERPLVELALSLYNDVPLLRHVLSLAKVPEQVERVALSLADPVEGPFVLVTRGGQFVTCLGRGMSPGSLPIVTRRQLDTIAEKFEDLRRRMAEAENQTGGHTADLLDRVFDAGPWLSREEMLGLTSLAPLLGGPLLAGVIKNDARMIRRSIALRRAQGTGQLDDEALFSFHRELWGTAHLMVLLGAGGRDTFTKLGPLLARTTEMLTRSFAFFDFPFTIMRTLWTAGKLAKQLFPAYKQAYLETDHPVRMLHLAMGMTTMGLRHRAFEPDVRRVLPRHRFTQLAAEAKPGESSSAEAFLEMTRIVLRVSNGQLDDPSEIKWLVRDKGRLAFAAMLRRRSAYTPLSLVSLPDEVAFAAAACIAPPLIDSIVWKEYAAATPSFLSVAQAEDLYLPSGFLEQVRLPWSPADTIPLFGAAPKLLPKVNAPTPGRNDPCSCSSGKKYKKCCGR